MGCPDVPTAGLDLDLAALVAVVGHESDVRIVIGVVGDGAADVRELLPHTFVVARRVDETLPLDAIAASTLSIPGRCTVVVRRDETGWAWSLAPDDAVWPDPAPPPPPTPSWTWPEPTIPHPAVRLPIGRQVGLGGAAATCFPKQWWGRGAAPSPFFFGAVELDRAPGYFFVGAQLTPAYAAYCAVPYPFATGLFGAWVGGDTVRVGVFAELGVFAAQGGVRVAVTPWSGSAERVDQGVEVRVATGWGAEAIVAYTMAWRPTRPYGDP